jgi:chondroitin-sulfate-ABC endolyase/exolyase
VNIARKSQTSRDVDDVADTTGDFMTAWLDHGPAPTAASYEYLLMIRATAQAMANVAANLPFQVLQKNDDAHIIWDNIGHRWGCVLFVPQTLASRTVGSETLPIKAVDRPCLVMADAVTTGSLKISVADPDLNYSQQRALRVTVNGAWNLSTATGTVCAWQLPNGNQSVRVVSSNATETVLEITCQHGASYDISLTR